MPVNEVELNDVEECLLRAFDKKVEDREERDYSRGRKCPQFRPTVSGAVLERHPYSEHRTNRGRQKRGAGTRDPPGGSAFGLIGLVLGPVLLSLIVALLRFAQERLAEGGADPS